MTTEMQEPQFMTDAKGNQIRIENIKPIELARDNLVKEIICKGKELNAMLRDYKLQVFADIAAMVQMSAEEYGIHIGGKKGNVTLHSFAGNYKVVRAINESLSFDERLQAANGLIDECLTDWTANANPNIQTLINQAFEVDKEGKINTGRVLSLRRLDINDDRWKRAMDAISDSIQTVGSKSYVRLYERVGDSEGYVPISLDIAGV